MKEHSESVFITSVHQAVVEWIQVPNLTPQDIVCTFQVMQSLSANFGAVATIRGVPLIFKLQSMAQEDFIHDIPRQRPVAQVTVMWLDEICKLHNIQDLPAYSQSVKEAKIENGEWSQKLDEQAVSGKKELPTTLTALNDEEKFALNAVTHWLDRHVVVADMMKDKTLRSSDDSHGLELESKLYAEWNTINICKFGRAYLM
jgi:hypothetical protein